MRASLPLSNRIYEKDCALYPALEGLFGMGHGESRAVVDGST
ncbi:MULTISPECIES: hypothetical protein [unclassified Nocardiopsis]|nr:hypothetical protein [Nocardiopsis sp. TSRI0078]